MTLLSFADRIVVIHRSLEQAGIKHGFGGAIALAYFVGEPRATRDIDLNINVATAEARMVLDALPVGVDIPDDAAELIGRDGQIRLWWDGGSGVPVDLFFPQHEFHREVAREIHTVPFLETAIPIISSTHLVVFKCLYNRARDWPDIDAMLQAGTVDSASALHWIARLLGDDSAAYRRLVATLDRIAADEVDRSGSEMERPRVDWRTLGDR